MANTGKQIVLKYSREKKCTWTWRNSSISKMEENRGININLLFIFEFLFLSPTIKFESTNLNQSGSMMFRKIPDIWSKVKKTKTKLYSTHNVMV